MIDDIVDFNKYFDKKIKEDIENPNLEQTTSVNFIRDFGGFFDNRFKSHPIKNSFFQYDVEEVKKLKDL